VQAKKHFDAAIGRADHLLQLYDILRDQRSRGIRSDWGKRFKAFMGWPAGEVIERVDGKDWNSMLILRAAVGIDRTQFTHDYLSELLRAAVVATVSALDRYVHDAVVEHCWSLLTRAEKDIPAELRKIAVPVVATKRALQKQRAEPTSRPGHLVKAAIQGQLHREYTFQKPEEIIRAAKMLGITDFWTKVAGKMQGPPPRAEVIDQLRRIADRRNQIVHEADLIRKTKAKQVTLRDISHRDAGSWVDWIRQFVDAMEATVQSSM
jgi:hypothetical protein